MSEPKPTVAGEDLSTRSSASASDLLKERGAQPGEPVETPGSLVEPVETPPRAKKVPTRREFHGDVFVDDYEWMRAKDDPEVIAYLEAQNAYTEAQTAPLAGLRKYIFN